MAIWALADLHLAFGVPSKRMDAFGPPWEFYTEKIERAWREVVSVEDLVLLAGDISWAMRLEDARIDLEWIDQLPGTKVMIRGNHDYWWGSLSKINQILPRSCYVIQNNSFMWKDDVAIAGSRLWDTSEFSFNEVIDFKENSRANPLAHTDTSEEKDRIFQRELGRLEMSLKSMNALAKTRIVMTHYPPIGLDLKDSLVSRLLEKYQVQICVFGHLHNVKRGLSLFGTHHGIQYALTSCDYLDFRPLKL